MEKFGGNFRRIDRCDVTTFKSKVVALSEDDWNAVTWRQERYDAHNATQTIELVFDKDFRHDNPTKAPMYQRLDCDRMLAPITEAIADYYTGEGYIVRALLVRLRAGGRIPTHVDTGYSLGAARRIHVPIVTNDRVTFTIGGEIRSLAEGEIWEINNMREHAVANESAEHRVHLIVDWVVQ